MVFFKVFQTALPIFLVMAAGYFLGFYKKLNLEANTDLVMYLTSPCLALVAIAKGNFNPGDFLILWLAFFWVTFFLWLAIVVVSKILKKELSWMFLPVLFMNSANFGFPLALVFFGEAGLAMAVILNMINAILLYSYGIVIAKRGGNIWEFLKLPYIYAVLLGLFIASAKIKIPTVIFNPLLLIGNITIPLMLLGLGHRLHDFKIKYFLSSLGPTFLRFFGGFMLAWIFVYLFNVKGLPRSIILMLSALPAAVTGYAISEKYNFHREEVATAVTVSNFLGIIFVPLVIWLILYV